MFMSMETAMPTISLGCMSLVHSHHPPIGRCSFLEHALIHRKCTSHGSYVFGIPHKDCIQFLHLVTASHGKVSSLDTEKHSHLFGEKLFTCSCKKDAHIFSDLLHIFLTFFFWEVKVVSCAVYFSVL